MPSPSKHHSLHRRLGSFEVPIKFVLDHPFEVIHLMSNMLVVRAEQRFDTMSVHYVAACGLFPELPAGVQATSFVLMAERRPDNTLNLWLEEAK